MVVILGFTFWHLIFSLYREIKTVKFHDIDLKKTSGNSIFLNNFSIFFSFNVSWRSSWFNKLELFLVNYTLGGAAFCWIRGKTHKFYEISKKIFPLSKLSKSKYSSNGHGPRRYLSLLKKKKVQIFFSKDPKIGETNPRQLFLKKKVLYEDVYWYDAKRKKRIRSDGTKLDIIGFKMSYWRSLLDK